MLAKAAMTSRLNWGWVLFQAHTCCCWQDSDRIQFLQTVGPRALVPHLLLAGGCPQFLAKWTSLWRRQFTPASYLHQHKQAGRRDRVLARQKPQFSQLNLGSNSSSLLPHSLCQKGGLAHTQGEGTTKPCEQQEMEIVVTDLPSNLRRLSTLDGSGILAFYFFVTSPNPLFP